MKKLASIFIFWGLMFMSLKAQLHQPVVKNYHRYAPNLLHIKFPETHEPTLLENGQLLLPGLVIPTVLPGLGHWRPVHRLPVAQLNNLWKNAERNLGKKLPDPNKNFYFVVNDPKQLDQAKTLIEQYIPGMPVQYVPVPTNAVTPDFFPQQSYPLNVSSGINAEAVWSGYGNRGTGIKICDIEYGFNANHQDLPLVTVVGPTPEDPFAGAGIDHGTAVLGEIASLDNTWGTTGIASDVEMYFAGAYTDSTYDLAAAITNALSVLSAGDIILLEQQIDGPNYTGFGQFGLVPVEWYELYYDAIVLAVGQNVTVVEAAGNGEQNLDDAVYNTGGTGHYPFMPGNNSGAIIVGAGAVDTAFGGGDVSRSRIWFSNYGTRVDVQGNGQAVFTTGYGDFYSAEGYDLFYTSDFGGTSGASPIVTGAAALLQSVNKDITGTTLTPDQVRNLLVTTGKTQQAGTYPLSENIGPLPDVFQAVFTIAPPAGVNEINSVNQWTVFPNPGNGTFNLVRKQNANAQFMVYDTQGRLLQEQYVQNLSTTLDLSAQPEGIYLVQYTEGNNSQCMKLVITR